MTSEPVAPTFDLLLAALRHPNPHVRAGAAIALGKTGDARAIEPLADLLEDPVYFVYTSAGKALAAIGSPAIGALLAVIQAPPSLDSASRAYEALRAVRDPQAIDLLIAAVHYDEKLIRMGAIEALGQMQAGEALPILLDAARHPDDGTRQQAIMALGKLRHPEGIQVVAAALNDPDWQMRVTAVRTLGRIGTEEVILPLLATMSDPSRQVREEAAHMIQTLRIPQAVEILIAALNGADAWTRRHLARALGESGDPRTLPVLEKLAVEDDDVQVRLSAAQSLAKMGVPRGEMIILRTLNAPSAQTRTLAAIALGNIGNPKAIAQLLDNEIPHAKNGRSNIRQVSQEIVSALHRVGTPAVPALLEALASPERPKQETAFKALSEIGKAAAPDLLNALHPSAPPQLRQQAIRLLGLAGDARAVEPLTGLLQRGMVSTLSPRGLVNLLIDPTVEERKLAADALGTIALPACVPPLLSAARYDLDREVRERAGRALATLGDAESVLQLAMPQRLGAFSRAAVSGLVLLAVGVVVGSFAWVAAGSWAALLAAWGTGVLVGGVDGLAGEKRMVRGTLIGAGMVALWGVCLRMFMGEPTLFELMQWTPIRVGALMFGGFGGLLGTTIVNPLSRQYRVRYVPRGCMLLAVPGILAVAGMVIGVGLGAVLILRAGDPAFFRWFGGVALGILLFIIWLARGKRIELQKGLQAALSLLGMMILAISLSLSLPPSFAVWMAPAFPVVGAGFGWRSLPWIRRLAGMWVGMVAGLIGAGLGIWGMGMVK